MKNKKTIKYKKSTNEDDNFDNILDAIADSGLTKDKIKQIEAILNGSK